MAETKDIKVEDIKAEADRDMNCPVRKALYYITGFLSGPMCGRCFPCAMGSFEARVRLQRLTDGTGDEGDLSALRRIAANMVEASMCKKGKDTAKFLLEWIDKDVFAGHISGSCADKECLACVEYLIIPEKCTICGACRVACSYNAVLGEKKKPWQSGYPPFEIRQKRCVKCGECLKACAFGAVVVTGARSEAPVGV